MNKSEVRDIFDVKTHKICTAYIYDTVLSNGNTYIRPVTALICKPIDRNASFYIYNEAKKLLDSLIEKHNRDNSDEIVCVGSGKPLLKLNASELLDIENCLTRLSNEKLKEADRETLTLRWSSLKEILPDSRDMWLRLRFALDTDYSDDIYLASELFKTYDKRVHISEATRDFIEIGREVKDYSYDEVMNVAFGNGKIETLRNVVIGFVNKHGLLGILNSIFNISSDVLIGNLDIETTQVITFTGKACPAFGVGGNKAKPAHYDSLTMKMTDYIKLFFPDEPHMKYYDEFKELDDRYWVRYSEPLHIFLLAAWKFFLELETIRKAGDDEAPSMEFTGMSMGREFDNEYESWVYRFQFSSLFDAIRYYAIYGISNNLNEFRCLHCHKIVSKDKKSSKKKRLYCSPRCSNAYRAAKWRKEHNESNN